MPASLHDARAPRMKWATGREIASGLAAPRPARDAGAVCPDRGREWSGSGLAYRDGGAARTRPPYIPPRLFARDTSRQGDRTGARTTDRSWAMKIIARPIRDLSSIRRLMICARIETSSAETHSSARISFGATARARAIPARWHWPPDKVAGFRAACSGDRPTINSSSATRFRLAFRGRPACTCRTSAIALPMVIRGFRAE